ncbi:MAG: insulinase family protein, partial [Gemmatimonadetes bacterium]|nr:insulinase family protein [Gemmatimonadota bacterium]
PTPGEQLPVVRHVLDNGMTFLILPRHQAPTVSLVVHYPVGSVNEHLGNTGIAHVLEHMLFKGSREIGTTDPTAEAPLLAAADAAHDSLLAELARPRPDTARIRHLTDAVASYEDRAEAFAIPNEYAGILAAAGGRGLNATTSFEATRYFVELPANRLELWFALESDRMRNPVLRGFHTELDVVHEERHLRLETSPGGIIQTAMLATAFQVHPYGVPVIGHAADLEYMSRRQLTEYFRDYYGARNAVAAIVGDVDTDQVVEWAEAYFGEVPAGRPAPPVLAREPEQAGERRITVEFDAEPRLMIGWRAVSGLHEDAPALQMLASLLTAGRSTRLYRRLVAGDRSAIHVSAYLGPGFAHPGLFIVNAVPRAPHTTLELEISIYQELDDIRANPPDAAALNRIKNQIRAGEYRRLSGNLQLGMQIAESEAVFGDWRETFRLSRRILEVTPGDVQRVAVKYLGVRNRTVATIVTKGGSQ